MHGGDLLAGCTMSAWQPVGYHAVTREGTTHSLPVKVLVPVDRDSWKLSDAEYDDMRNRCAAFVADALNRCEVAEVTPMCGYDDCDEDGPVRIGEQTFCHYHAADGLLSGLGRHWCADLIRIHMPHDVLIPRALAAEIVATIGDLRECDGNPFLTAANARAQRLALTLAEMLEAKP
jgi:hypothetical protein